MANLKVALLLRTKTTNGNRPYLNPVMAGNGKIRPLWAVYKNQPTHFPDGIYCPVIPIRIHSRGPISSQRGTQPAHMCGEIQVSRDCEGLPLMKKSQWSGPA